MPTLDRRKSLVRCLDAVDKSPADAGGRHEVLGPLEDSCVRAELDNARRTNAKSASRRLAILRPPMTPTPHHTSEKLQAPDKKSKVQARQRTIWVDDFLAGKSSWSLLKLPKTRGTRRVHGETCRRNSHIQ